MKRKVLIISAALALILAGCTGQTNTQSDFVPGGNTSQSESSEGVHPQSVSLDKESLEMEVGQSVTLVATVLPNDADDKTVLWSASGDGVVSVDDGVVKALKAGQAVVTARTRDGGHTATCNVTVKDEDEGQKPEGAVDLEYSTADNLSAHGDNWVYFNDPSWWSGASARVNEAYTYNETVVFDYTYLDIDNPSAPYENWSVQLMRKNTSLTKGTTYDLSLKMNSNKAGKVILNDVEKTVTVGDNTLSLTYKEGDAASINIQFPMGMIGSARVVLSEVKWSAQGQGGGGEQGGGEQGGGESSIAAPEGVVVNPVDGGYIVAFAAVAGATGYKAYYVDSNGQDVDNEVVTNGGRLTKVDSLADGEYKVYVTTLKDDQESARSTSFGTLIIGQTDKDPVAPVGVVVNAIEGGYIVAFAGVPGATGYKAYYVDSNGQDVANEEVTNGGRLTKVDSLPAGTYKVYVSTLIGEKESPRSESFGTFTK